MYDFIAIDFETATEELNSACSLGIACVNNFEIVDKKYYLIQPPENKYNPLNTAIHGLTAEDTKDAPTFDHVWSEISELFQDCIVVAHNVRFDLSVLKCCADMFSISVPDFQYIDSIAVSNKVIHDNGYSKTLVDRAAYFNIPIEEHHNALSDAVTCAQIVIASVRTTNRKSFRTYCSSFRRRTTHMFSELKPMTSLPHSTYRKAPKIGDLTPISEVTDASHPLYGKNVVITGNLSSLSRAAVMQKIVDVGGLVKSGVSPKTDFLIVGVQNPAVVGEDGLSSKERKAQELIASGKEITILHEKEFLEMFE